MLGYIGKAARLVLLLVANPNLLLLIKDVRLIKTGGRLELEVRTHSRNTVASSPTGSSPPSLPRAHGKGVKSLLVRNTLPAIAAAARRRGGGYCWGCRVLGEPSFRLCKR